MMMRRTLDKFPMKYSFADTSNHQHNQRIERARTQVAIQRALNSSNNLSNYTKRLFDDALLKVQSTSLSSSQTSSGSSSAQSSKSMGTSSSSLPSINGREPRKKRAYISMPQHSGPTPYGSVLYNKKPHLMNSIRMRSNSEPPMFEHIKTVPSPNIKMKLQRSNSLYKVITPSVTPSGSMGSIAAYSCPTPLGYTDFVLLPNYHEAEPIVEAPEDIVEPEHELMVSETSGQNIPVSVEQEDKKLPQPPVNVMITHTDDEEVEAEADEKMDDQDKESVGSRMSRASSAASSVKSNTSDQSNVSR